METHNFIPDFIAAYIQGEAKDNQIEQSVKWIQEGDNLNIYNELIKINQLSSDLQHINEFSIVSARKKIQRKYRSNQIRNISKWVQRVAAILFLPALLGGIWYYMQQIELRKDFNSLVVSQEIVTQPGTKTHLFLPDSTEVWLNSASKLRFPSVFAGDNRAIYLEGEAYFKVYHNKRKPFIVNTQFLKVEAIGTAFNLSAYSGDTRFSTTLEEGKVKITDEIDASKVTVINPGTQLNYDTNNKLYAQQTVVVQDIIAWKDGVLIFNETPFEEVVAKLGRWFNADIKITDKSIVRYRFTGTFTSESLDQVLNLLTLSAPIEFSCSKRRMLQNRSFSKQEIKIWKNPKAKVKTKN